MVSAIINGIVEGLSVSPDDPNEVANYICKFHIPNEDRLGCMNSLRRMNIHHANLFPDPMGASEYCNDWLARAVFEERRKNEEKAAIAAREQSYARRAEPSGILTGDDPDLKEVVKIIEIYTDATDLDFDNLATKLNNKYLETSAVDWPKYESGTARVRSAFKRILLAAGFTEPSRDRAADALVQHYQERYWKTEKST